MHHAPIAKAHLMLGGVNVDVHHPRIEFEKEHEGRMPAVEQHVAVCLAHRMGDQLVADHPTIHTEILQIRLTAGEGRQPHPTPQTQTAALLIDGNRLFDKGRTEDTRHSPLGFLLRMGRAQTQYRAAVVTQVESHIEACQSQALDHLFKMTEFGLLGTQKLSAGGGIEEQITDFDRGALGMRSRLHPGVHVAAFGFHLPRLIGPFGAGGQQQARHRAHRCQRLPAKTQGSHPLKIVQIHYLAGRVAGQRQRQIALVDAAAIVPHPQQLDAALLHIDINTRCTGIQAVLQQFLDNRRWTFYHFTRGNLVRQTRAQQLNTGHLQPHDHIRGHFEPTCCRPAP